MEKFNRHAGRGICEDKFGLDSIAYSSHLAFSDAKVMIDMVIGRPDSDPRGVGAFMAWTSASFGSCCVEPLTTTSRRDRGDLMRYKEMTGPDDGRGDRKRRRRGCSKGDMVSNHKGR